MSYDYVIVGGGSAGATLAARLSERPGCTVLVLEAGADGPLGTADDRVANVSFAATPRDWGMRAHVTSEREVEYPQGRFVGGGSSVNGALAFRGTPSDYDGWAAAGNPSWSYAHLLPCLRRLEDDHDFGTDTDVHGRGGPIPIVRWPADDLVPLQEAFRAGCEATGSPWCTDLNAPGTAGVGPLPMNRDGAVRVSTALAYLAPARERANLDVRGGAHAARVCIERGRAVGVEVLTAGGTERIDAGTVVLSAGSILTPGLLWRSGVGPGDALRELGIEPVVDNPAVGANLTDHPGAFVFAQPADDVGPTDPQYQLAARASSTTGTADDLFVSMMNVFDLAAMPDLRAALGAPTAVVLTCGVHEPRSRGRVTLESADPRAAPRIELNLLSDPADASRLVEGIRRCREVARAGMSKFVRSIAFLDDDDFADDARLEAYARSVAAPWYHPVGTCRMGPADAGDTVVGDDLAVHGVEGLRVVDASIMPAITKAPTNITTIAIAERAAELLAAAS
ncbi:MAG TPA: GMC family oxidoreductase N-terminal domain-containing protein [Acidimicrobiia bacterium]|nr:GMC family oxidoreductase N-terminal domain-containing protein [Acidimicrobiia bacterium]